MAQATAEIRVPGRADFGWVFLLLAGAGAILALRHRKGRASAIFAAAIVAQASVLFVLAAVRDGDTTPYMAIKMVHLALYPAAVFGAVAVASAWRVAAARARGPATPGALLRPAGAWTLVALTGILAARHVAAMPVQPMTVSGPLYEAGRWARAHVPPECVDYLVAGEQTAYWLHLAVLGSRRMSTRTADDRTFAPTENILRWINRTGMPYAVADLDDPAPRHPRERRRAGPVRHRGRRAASGRELPVERGPGGCGGSVYFAIRPASVVHGTGRPWIGTIRETSHFNARTWL